jgi:hypothetical protein
MSRFDEFEKSLSSRMYEGPYIDGTLKFKPTSGKNMLRLLPENVGGVYEPIIEQVSFFRINGPGGKNYTVGLTPSDIEAGERPLAKAFASQVAAAGGAYLFFKNPALSEYFYRRYLLWVVARPIVSSSGAESNMECPKNVPLIAGLGYELVKSIIGSAREFQAAGVNVVHPKNGRNLTFSMERIGKQAKEVKYAFMGFAPVDSPLPDTPEVREFVKSPKKITDVLYLPSPELEEELASVFVDTCSSILLGDSKGPHAARESYKAKPVKAEHAAKVYPSVEEVAESDSDSTETDDIPW